MGCDGLLSIDGKRIGGGWGEGEGTEGEGAYS